MVNEIRMPFQMVRWLIIPLLLFSFCAYAQPKDTCSDRKLTIKEFESVNGKLIFRGYSDEKKVMVELWASPMGGWALMITHPDYPGTMCRVDSGRWSFVPPKLEGKGI